MTASVIITCIVAGGWLLLACALPWLRPAHQPRALWGLVALGVPVLGWLTLNWGPMAGIAGLALGLAALFWPPRRPSRDRAVPPFD